MTTPIYALQNFPTILHACNAARRAARQRYRTRLKEVSPPAVAVSIPAGTLPCSNSGSSPQGEAILVALPGDFEGSLVTLAAATQMLVVHPDVSLTAQEAYLSLSLPAKAPALPVTVWIELKHVVEASKRNEECFGSRDVQIAFASGNEFVVTSLLHDDARRTRIEEALRVACTPPRSDSDRRAKGRDTASRYGERPWLFMRYELRAGVSRIAVNWAPFPEKLPSCVLDAAS